MSKIIRTRKPSVLPYYAAVLAFVVLCAVLPVYRLWALLAALGAAVLAFAGANVGSFLLGRASAEHNSVSWEEASVFYAQIVERRENTLLVEGLPVNNVNHRGQFSFTLGEDTRLLWRGEEITQEALHSGDTVAVTYSGETLEVYPVMLPQVYQVLLLEDEDPTGDGS